MIDPLLNTLNTTPSLVSNNKNAVTEEKKTEQSFKSIMEQSARMQVSSQAHEAKDAKATPAQEFLEYMGKSNEERFFMAFLKNKGLTEEEFDALSIEDKQKLLEEFREDMRKQIEEDAASI